ncbi:MAG: glycosyltransferase family 39 protein [Verrucomicrobiota bacterium]
MKIPARVPSKKPFPIFQDSYSVIAIGVILIGMLILLVGAWSYPLDQQQDNGYQFSLIGNLYKNGEYISYVGIYYYALITTVIHWVSAIGLTSDENVVQMSAIFVNTLCFTTFMLGAYKSGGLLFREKRTTLFFLAIIAAMPVFQSQFRYVRCENLILSLSSWCLYLALLIKHNKYRPKQLALLLSLLLAIAISQKITAIVLLPTCLAVLLFQSDPAKQFIPAISILFTTALLSCTLWFGHYQFTGVPFFRHNAVTHQTEDYFHKPTPDLFTRVNPVDAWKKPIRNDQSDSFGNVLWLDLYGDYWEYRYNYPIRRLPRDHEGYAFAVQRARFGLLVGTVFFAVCAVGFLPNKKQITENESESRITIEKRNLTVSLIQNVHLRYPQLLWLGLSVAPIFMLITASYAQAYDPGIFGIVKWEYISWSLVYWLVPSLSLMESEEGRRPQIIRILLLAICSAGIYQSIY